MKKHGIETQFGSQRGKGTRDGIFSLRSLLQIRRNHGQETYALFIDLIKAFDTTRHNLLEPILQKFGAPPPLTKLIASLYKDMTVTINLEGEEREVPYTCGVRQGDNMSPVIFLFYIHVAMILTRKEAKRQGVQDIRLNMPKSDIRYGKLSAQNTNAKGREITLNDLLYVDDTAYLTDNHEDLLKMASIIEEQFKRIGLLMHVGDNNKKSKSVAMYFPPSVKASTLDQSENEADFTTTSEGQIQFVKKFKYLGSWITTDLYDDTDITNRIAKGWHQMGQNSAAFKSKHLSLQRKRDIYVVMVLNTVIFGCESWSLSHSDKRKLESFHHKCLRRIMGISMFTVQMKRITNKFIREKMEIRNITDYIYKRQLDWLGHLGKFYINNEATEDRNKSHFQQFKLLFAWSAPTRPTGQPQRNLRTAYKESLTKIYPDLPKDGDFKIWRPDIESGLFKEKTETWWEQVHPTHQKANQEPRIETENSNTTIDQIVTFEGGLLSESDDNYNYDYDLDFPPLPSNREDTPLRDSQETAPSGLIPDSVEFNPPTNVSTSTREWWRQLHPRPTLHQNHYRTRLATASDRICDQ